MKEAKLSEEPIIAILWQAATGEQTIGELLSTSVWNFVTLGESRRLPRRGGITAPA